MNLRTIAIFSALILPTAASLAGGPPYSRFGIGDLLFFGGNRAYAMGVSGVALSDDGFINLMNPAALSRLSFTRVSGGFEYRSSTLKDASGSQRFATGGFQSLALAIPASQRHGISLFAATRPTSLVDYSIQIRDVVGGTASTQTVSGTGGLSELILGGSYRPAPVLSLGVKYTYHYGAIQQRLIVDFDDNSFSDNEVRKTFYHKGSSFTFGMTYAGFESLFQNPSFAPLTFGLTVTTPASLSIKEERLLLTQRAADTALVRRGSGEIPFEWAAGLTYSAPSMIISGDLAVQYWNRSNFFDPPSVEIRNSLRTGIGVEFLPKRDPVTYWERVAYRAGFAYTASYIDVNGQPVDSWAVSGGVALPIGPDARMNLGVQVGSRGTTVNGLPKETFYKLSVSIDASEAWFITLEED